MDAALDKRSHAISARLDADPKQVEDIIARLSSRRSPEQPGGHRQRQAMDFRPILFQRKAACWAGRGDYVKGQIERA